MLALVTEINIATYIDVVYFRVRSGLLFAIRSAIFFFGGGGGGGGGGQFSRELARLYKYSYWA